jgi:hypothetical protein
MLVRCCRSRAPRLGAGSPDCPCDWCMDFSPSGKAKAGKSVTRNCELRQASSATVEAFCADNFQKRRRGAGPPVRVSLGRSVVVFPRAAIGDLFQSARNGTHCDANSSAFCQRVIVSSGACAVRDVVSEDEFVLALRCWRWFQQNGRRFVASVETRDRLDEQTMRSRAILKQ